MSKTTEKPSAYQGVECGNCGGSIAPGEWCGNPDCYMGDNEWESNLSDSGDKEDADSNDTEGPATR